MKKLQAYNNDPLLKESMIEQMKAHMEQDKVIQGTYGDERGFCAVGCALDSLNLLQGKSLSTSDHERFESELGIPEILAHIEDALFEAMSKEDSKTFPLRFIEAINVGADLSMVFAKLIIWEWEDDSHGLKNIEEIKNDAELFKCCEDVVSCYKRTIAGETVPIREWDSLEELADKLARTRTRAGAWAWAWAGARTGARAGAWARTGAWAWAWAWARESEYQKQIMVTVEALLKIISETK